MSLWANAELARAYAEVRTDLSETARTVWIDAFRSAIPATPRRRLLDVGCGTGRFTALLAETFGAPAIGIDGSVAMLRERSLAPRIPVTFLGAEAAALPLRDAAIDVALLSMVFHLLATPADAVAALHRVVRPGGWVLVRTPTLELLDSISWLPFFPGARAVDEARMPTRAMVIGTFASTGFTPHARRTVEQEFARTPAEALEKARRRPFSTLRQISDAAFAEGLTRYAAHCRSMPPVPPREALDLFVFHHAW